MKLTKTITLIFLCFIQFTLIGQNSFFKKADSFFQKNIKNGLVDYREIHIAPSELDTLILEINNFDISVFSDNEKLAFYINCYNLHVIKKVIEHYPISSPMDIPNFFESDIILISGKKMSLNKLENNIIRPQFNDARIHFALVCGALGCPPLMSGAYFPKNVQALLAERTRMALQNSSFLQYKEGKLILSQIFNWYKVDFGENSSSIIQFINQHSQKKLPTNLQISYNNYDWSLNTQK